MIGVSAHLNSQHSKALGGDGIPRTIQAGMQSGECESRLLRVSSAGPRI